MALARVLEIIAFLIYIQEIRGQFNGLINNNPSLGQNNLNQGFQNTANIKSVAETLFQNENLGKNMNFNAQKQVNSPQASISQPLLSISPQFPLQQMQNLPQTLNQSPQNSDVQPPLSYQHQLAFVQQPSTVQQSYNYLKSSPAYVPVNNVEINYQKQQTTPTVQPAPVQVPQTIPLTNSYTPTYPSTSPVLTCGGQRLEFVANLGGKYLVPISALPYSLPEGQVVSAFPTFPYSAVIPASYPTPFGNNVVSPYQNQVMGTFINPFDNFNESAPGEESSSFNSDKMTKLIMSLLESPKKVSKYLQSGYQDNSYSPYAPYRMDQDTKPSSLKALLPIILNLLKERREGCGCQSCACNRKNRNKKDSESQHEDFSKKNDHYIKEEMFDIDGSEEDMNRITRDHKKYKKIKTPIPEVSIESNENDETDYDNNSEEED